MFLDIVSKEPYLCTNFYFTGGTALAAFYLFHRISEDIDLFSEEEINLLPIRTLVRKVQKMLGIKKIDYRQFLGLHSFQFYFEPPNTLAFQARDARPSQPKRLLRRSRQGGEKQTFSPKGKTSRFGREEVYFSETNLLKIDFNYYPFPRIEKGVKYHNLEIDSILDIAVNKVHTIAMRPRARDFIDIYFIIKEKGYDFHDLLMKAKAKFDWHIDQIQLGSRLYLAKEQSDFPRMLKKVNHDEWKSFFIEEARKLKKEIFK